MGQAEEAQCEQMSSELPLSGDIAQHSPYVSKVAPNGHSGTLLTSLLKDKAVFAYSQLDQRRVTRVAAAQPKRLVAKEKAAQRRLVLGQPSCLFLDGVSGVPRCILHIARGVMGGSLGLINLAFGFHVFVTTELTGTFFDGAFGLVGSALHMFAIHDRVPLLSRIWDNERVALWFLGEQAPVLHATTSELGISDLTAQVGDVRSLEEICQGAQSKVAFPAVCRHCYSGGGSER